MILTLPPRPAPLGSRAWFSFFEFTKAHLRRIAKAHQVHVVDVRGSLREAKIVAVVIVRNEAERMPFLLNYYFHLGVDHVIVIDNGSTDDLREIVVDDQRISLFSAVGSYRTSRYGDDWVNHVLSRYCAGKWTLYVDADEILVYAGSERHGLADLVSVLDANKLPALPCVMIDLYSDSIVSENRYRRGEDPLTVCRLYDTGGYEFEYEQMSGTTWVKGGMRGRMFFANVQEGPALNKLPLVKWHRHFAYLKSSHQLWPLRLNEVAARPHLTGALLHQKFLASFGELVADDAHREEHNPEYDAYLGLSQRGGFRGPTTREYSAAEQLLADGLISPTPWS